MTWDWGNDTMPQAQLERHFISIISTGSKQKNAMLSSRSVQQMWVIKGVWRQSDCTPIQFFSYYVHFLRLLHWNAVLFCVFSPVCPLSSYHHLVCEPVVALATVCWKTQSHYFNILAMWCIQTGEETYKCRCSSEWKLVHHLKVCWYVYTMAHGSYYDHTWSSFTLFLVRVTFSLVHVWDMMFVTFLMF